MKEPAYEVKHMRELQLDVTHLNVKVRGSLIDTCVVVSIHLHPVPNLHLRTHLHLHPYFVRTITC